MKRRSNKLVAGVGINDADYAVVRFSKTVNGKKTREWVCPYYKTWAAMLNRCYRNSSSPANDSYKDTTVCEEWLKFSKFKSWMEKQDWKGMELDKDLLSEKNRYSPTTCVFIPGWLNSYLVGGKPRFPMHLPGIVYKSDLGVYIVNVHTKEVVERISQSFTNVISAISYYHKERSEFALRSQLDDNLKHLVQSYFDRKYSSYLKVVNDNPQLFPSRKKPIAGQDVPQIGSRFVTNKGYSYKVTSLVNADSITILFDCGLEKVVSNTQIKKGNIKKSVINDAIHQIKARIDKIFKWNSHGLIAGIQYYPPNHIGVAYNSGSNKGCRYFKNIKDALEFRKSQLVVRVQKIVGKNLESMSEALDYFESRWVNEVAKYSGSIQ